MTDSFPRLTNSELSFILLDIMHAKFQGGSDVTLKLDVVRKLYHEIKERREADAAQPTQAT